MLQDLIGSALPAIEGDELDVTVPTGPKQPEQGAVDVTPLTPSAGSEGLSVLQKLIFFGFILGAVAVFMRSRKGSTAIEKSLA